MTLVSENATAKAAHLWRRDGLDWYVEPERVTDALLDVETFEGPIWDPACGGGNVIRACQRRGLEAVGSDIANRGFGDVQDFLADGHDLNVANIICNPPFFRAKGTEAFIRKALSVAQRKVAIFTSIKFLAGQARARGLWREYPPARVWIIAERPSCPPGEWLAAGNTASGGTDDWIWVVWVAGRQNLNTELGWLRGRP